ncbi:MAG: VOC family protein [Chloroflexi bacterium]|nr:VOC family protein [Chloroflexota bacterium]
MTTEGRVTAPAAAVAPEAVNHLVLNVRDMERAHDFWTRIIGFKQVGELHRPEQKLWMRFYQGAAGNHHDLALSQVMGAAAAEEAGRFSMAARRPGLNHVAIKWGDRESWLKQVAWLQSQGVVFHARIEHGMTHSVYISDPDGHGIEVLYELPREVWEQDIDGALNYAEVLPTEGPETLEDNTAYKVFTRPAG